MNSDGTGQRPAPDHASDAYESFAPSHCSQDFSDDPGRIGQAAGRANGQAPAYTGLAQDVVACLLDSRRQAAAIRQIEGRSLARRPGDVRLVAVLCQSLLNGDETGAQAMLSQQLSAGRSTEALHDCLLGPACEELGRLWDTDDVGFFRMTVGIGTVYALLRWLRDRPEIATPHGQCALGICLASVPGETHTIGLTMVADRLRRHGWTIELQVGKAHQQLLSAISAGGYAVVALSAATAQQLPSLARIVSDISALPTPPRVILCGRILDRVTGIAGRLGTGSVPGSGAAAISDMNQQLHAAAEAARIPHATPMPGD